MRLSDFWVRLESVLGPAYAHSWASDIVVAELGGRTVDQAIADGIDTVVIWRAVCRTVPVPDFLR